MYRAPLKDLRFVLLELIGEAGLQACPSYADYSLDIADAVLEEAGKFAENVLDPLYKSGDRQGARWTPDGVIGAPGFKEAYQQYAEGGWTSLRAPTEFGGQGVPTVLGTAVEELWSSSNLAFKLCPMLTQGAIEALDHYGTPAQKAQFLPKMVSGEWTGTMNLTEPQAGSDLAAIRTRAQRIAQQIKAGTVWINMHGRLAAEIETGGYKESGLGRLHGVQGLEEFLQTKHVAWELGAAVS